MYRFKSNKQTTITPKKVKKKKCRNMYCNNNGLLYTKVAEIG